MVYFKSKHVNKVVVNKLVLMIAQTKTVGHTIKCFLSDNGGEFDNASIKSVLDTHGIVQRLVTPYTPEQNGVREQNPS